MQRLLFLAHRIPYPPNKGDKIRSYHLMRHLSSRYRLSVGAFVDDDGDFRHRVALQQHCERLCLVPISPGFRRVRSLSGLLHGESLSAAFYRDTRMREWIDVTLAEGGFAGVFVYSSSMAQYAMSDAWAETPRIADFVDVDSAKWAQYAARRPWPLRWVYEREARRLLALERSVAQSFDATLFVSEEEAALFRSLAPEAASRVHAVRNGVDTDYFSTSHRLESPFPPDELPLVFTGAMDYWANVDAVCWFAQEILPMIRDAVGAATFYVVGARPTAAVRRLRALAGVRVTGKVEDVRPFLAHARGAVATLRVARGLQNKVLEALAMSRAVLATPEAFEGIRPTSSLGRYVASGPDALAACGVELLTSRDTADEVGRAGRRFVQDEFAWATSFADLDALLDGAASVSAPAATEQRRIDSWQSVATSASRALS